MANKARLKFNEASCDFFDTIDTTLFCHKRLKYSTEKSGRFTGKLEMQMLNLMDELGKYFSRFLGIIDN